MVYQYSKLIERLQMNKLIGYNARDFLVIMEQVKAKVHDKMCKKLNEGLDYPKYYPEFINVSLFDKGTGMELYEVFRNLCKKDEYIPTLTDDEFTTLECYSSLSQETKDQVNKMLYPLTVTGKTVRLIHPRGWYNIFVEKEEFINEHLATTELDGDIIPVIS